MNEIKDSEEEERERKKRRGAKKRKKVMQLLHLCLLKNNILFYSVQYLDSFLVLVQVPYHHRKKKELNQ